MGHQTSGSQLSRGVKNDKLNYIYVSKVKNFIIIGNGVIRLKGIDQNIYSMV